MASVKAGNLTKGMFVSFRNDPCQVVKAEFYHPGKGSAVNRVKLRNLITGSVIDFTFKSQESIEELDVPSREMQFLYADQDQVVFMDPRTYEQVELPIDLLDDKVGYLTPDVKVYVLFFQDKALSVSLPPKVKLKVTTANEAVAGNTVNAPKKEVEMETGLKVMVPLFVKQGETIIVDTQTGEYVSRAN